MFGFENQKKNSYENRHFNVIFVQTCLKYLYILSDENFPSLLSLLIAEFKIFLSYCKMELFYFYQKNLKLME